MRKKKRVVLLLAAMLASVGLLTACVVVDMGGKDEQSTTTAAPQPTTTSPPTTQQGNVEEVIMGKWKLSKNKISGMEVDLSDIEMVFEFYGDYTASLTQLGEMIPGMRYTIQGDTVTVTSDIMVYEFTYKDGNLVYMDPNTGGEMIYKKIQ